VWCYSCSSMVCKSPGTRRSTKINFKFLIFFICISDSSTTIHRKYCMNKCYLQIILINIYQLKLYTKFQFLRLAETKCANAYVNWGAEHENYNKHASLTMVLSYRFLPYYIISRQLRIALVQSGRLRLPIERQIWRSTHRGPATISKHWWATFPFLSALHCRIVLV
jgi:hypothetical protein